MTTWNDLQIMALTVWGESRGESFDGQLAVAHVILNRAKVPGKTWWGDTIAHVCLNPWQFSCHNPGDPNTHQIERLMQTGDLSDPALQWCLLACVKALTEKHDPTGGATHYHVRGLSPKWARGQTPAAEIGAHLFFRLGAEG